MKALVTGSSGFLGRHLCRELERRGWEVFGLTSKDLLWPQIKFDYLFHLAAYTQAGNWCLTHAGEQWLVNQKINWNALEWWKKVSSDAKLITIGSSCAYAPGSNLREEDYMKGEPHESLYTYAMTKRMLYEGCRALNKQYGMKYLYLVPSTLYGPDYHTDGRQAHFIFDLIRKIIRGKELGEPVVLWGDGDQIREVIYVDDFIKIILTLNETDRTGIFNVGGDRRTISQFADTICIMTGYDYKKIVYDTSKYVGAGTKSLSCQKLASSMELPQRSTLESGIKKVIDWYYESGAWK